MAQYTIEDIEILRQKSGISYEEAVNLLEYHNGSLARALVDLEKNGRLRDTKAGAASGTHRSKKNNFFTYFYRLRLKVSKGNVTIVNLSSLFVLFTTCTAFWVLILGLMVAMLLGYRISVERNSKDFAGESFESMVKNASSNVKNTVFTIVKDMGMVGNPTSEQGSGFYEEQPRTENAASGTTPVNVQFPDGGSVDVKEDKDGFHEADIQ